MKTESWIVETELRTWMRFIAAHSAITRELEAQLMGAHGLTLSDYDVLVQLARAPERKLRNIELAKAVVLTRSGVTRLVDGLERDGLVTRASCPDDKRGTLVALTAEGARRLREAALDRGDRPPGALLVVLLRPARDRRVCAVRPPS